MVIELNSYMGYTVAIILTCIAVVLILGMVILVISMLQDIMERIPSLIYSFREWRKSRVPDDFYHLNLDEAIKLCEDKSSNRSLNSDQRAHYRTLENWLTEYKYLKNKYEENT